MLAVKTRATPAQSGPRSTRPKWKRYSSGMFYTFVSPWVLGFLVLTAVPMIYALLVSFTNYDGIDRWHWVGLTNY